MYGTGDPSFLVNENQREAVGGIDPDNKITDVCNNRIHTLEAFSSNRHFPIVEVFS